MMHTSNPTPAFTQKTVDLSRSVMAWRWIRADARPVPLRTGSNTTTSRTMPAMPYWCGVGRRANADPNEDFESGEDYRVAGCSAS